VEFPRIDDRRAGLAARYSVAVGDNNLLRYDFEAGTAQESRFRGEPGEAVFAASNPGELSGYYMTYVYDAARNGSDLVIIDASDFTGEPVARVQLPHRVPHGFHGNWITD
jgi:carotenoid cleavage dioxygenase